MSGLKILSTGYYAPQKVLDNFDLEKVVETSDEWIVSRTGIKRRHIAENESCVELGYQAALKAVEKIDKSKIGLIICATKSGATLNLRSQVLQINLAALPLDTIGAILTFVP